MITLPLDPSLTLMAMSDARPQIKDQKTGEIATDRDTGERIYQLDVAMALPNARPQTFQLAVPESGLSPEIAAFSPFHAVSLIFISGEKNGRTWQMYRAAGLTPLVTSTTTAKAA